MTEPSSDWNDFVSASPWGDVLQFVQWGEVKKNEGWQPHFVQSDDGRVRSLVLSKRASKLGNYLYIPHGPVFHTVQDLRAGIASWKVNLLALAKELNAFAIHVEPKVGAFVDETQEGEVNEIQEENKRGLEQFTYGEIVKILEENGFEITGRNMQPKYKLLYSLELEDEKLLQLMNKSTRYNVRYAEKKGVVVNEYLPDDPQIEKKIEEFYGLLEVTQDRTKGYPIRPLSSFKRLFEVFKGTKNIALFEAKFENDLIVMNISERTNHWASSFYAGSNRNHPNLKAPYLLRWKSIQAAKAFGSKTYDFWGIIPNSSAHKGYSDHKLGFGGARIDYVGIMELIIDKKRAFAFNKLVPLRGKLAALKRKFI